MQRSWSSVPHAWAEQIVDITDVEAHRQKLKRNVADDHVVPTMTAYLARAMALAIVKYPRFNACYDAAKQLLIYRNYVNIGVAVDTDRGLLVPVIRDVDGKSVREIARELGELSTKVRLNKVAPQDLQGAGITLSNLGSMGVTGLMPLVNWPEVAILGAGSARREPTVIGSGSDVSIRLNMPITLGFDHRVINGADAARFLGEVKRLLEGSG